MSQMKPADVEITNIKIFLRNGDEVEKYYFTSKKEFILFDGFLILNNYNKFSNENPEEENSDEEKEIDGSKEDLKHIKKDLILNYLDITAQQKYSRHPNYFFEWLIWSGFAVLASDGPLWYIGLGGMLLMLLLLLKVTGIPHVEREALRKRGDAWRQYQKETSVFIPLPPRKRTSE